MAVIVILIALSLLSRYTCSKAHKKVSYKLLFCNLKISLFQLFTCKPSGIKSCFTQIITQSQAILKSALFIILVSHDDI